MAASKGLLARMPDDDLDLIVDAAKKGGELALGYFGAANEVWEKKGNSPVSQADIAVDTYLRQSLCEIRPEYGWLSEETADDLQRLAARRIFIVDPIDGTRGFLRGDKQWCISIAVADNGAIAHAVLHCPALGLTFAASAGKGAFLNDRRLETLRGEVLKSITGSRRVNEQLQRTYPDRFAVPPFIASLAYRIALVAQGRIDGALAHAGSHEWDVAAADLILREAGGVMTTIDGSPLAYNQRMTRKPAIVAAASAQHARLLDIANSARIIH